MGEWKPGKSFFWDDNGKFIEPKWKDLKERIETESGGIAIAADDLAYLLQYDMGYRRHHSRREYYLELAAHITQEEDFDILSKGDWGRTDFSWTDFSDFCDIDQTGDQPGTWGRTG